MERITEKSVMKSYTSFCESLSLDYFHKENPLSFKENINRLKQIFYSEEF